MRRHRARSLSLLSASAATALVVTACGTGNASTARGGHAPVTVGISLPLSGQFSADGIASERGYQLWASGVNTHGGLLGHPVHLEIRDDRSDPNVVTRDYTQLITQDHVAFTLAPFSSLLTVPAGQVTEKYGYALPEGSGAAPTVYALHDHDLFGVSTPVVDQMVPFAHWVLSLSGQARPTTAAYPLVDDPFADPPVLTVQHLLEAGGIRTVFSNAAHPASPTGNLARVADAVAAKKPDVVVLGSVDIPSLLAFVHAFEKDAYNPRIFIASSGPDQGEAFLNRVGPFNAEAMMVPDGWYGAEQNALSHVMVQDYISRFGGTTNDINADTAEAYSAGEVLAAAVAGTGSLSNAKIITYLHTHTMQTVQGPATFRSDGENTYSVAQSSIYQWHNSQFVKVLPAGSPGSAAIEVTKPHWQIR